MEDQSFFLQLDGSLTALMTFSGLDIEICNSVEQKLICARQLMKVVV